ncbi:MAG: DEAD/DEAH box helicase, partial [Spongiibacter sp.]|nr:DEAD/DEAH box helicase [Spongiibacter sp.]
MFSSSSAKADDNTAAEAKRSAAPTPADSSDQSKNAERQSDSRAGGRKRSRAKKKPPQQAWSLDQFQVPEEEGKTRFHDLGLDESLMHGIADAGFQYCSPIQAASLPHTLRGNDVIGKAQTGTGKTAAFLITIFNDL